MSTTAAHPITGPCAWVGGELANSRCRRATLQWGSIEPGSLRGGIALA